MSKFARLSYVLLCSQGSGSRYFCRIQAVFEASYPFLYDHKYWVWKMKNEFIWPAPIFFIFDGRVRIRSQLGATSVRLGVLILGASEVSANLYCNSRIGKVAWLFAVIYGGARYLKPALRRRVYLLGSSDQPFFSLTGSSSLNFFLTYLSSLLFSHS